MRTRISTPDTTTNACVYCHHPHIGLQSDLLWSFNSAPGSFVIYGDSPALNAPGTGDEMGTTNISLYTLYCMACHDGVTAKDALNKHPSDGKADDIVQIEVGTSIPKWAKLDVSLKDYHPVDFNYVGTARGNFSLTQPNGTIDITGSYTSTTYPLYNGTMQCATCHDVHNGVRSETLNSLQFLRGVGKVLDESLICLDCHVNK